MKVLITGGAGFIGCNLAHHHLDKGDSVVVFDNLSRKGTELNLQWLMDMSCTGKLEFVRGDIRNVTDLQKAFTGKYDYIYHFAAQVAVTTSVKEPRIDFEINAMGTFNLLESVRKYTPEAIVIYSSTNKVYGGLDLRKIKETDTRYELADRQYGIDENEPLDFHSPYGCSKGCGDQYVRDYSRIYGLRTIVFRQSCIYGIRQFGVEDQGWVAYFCLAAKFGTPFRIYGNGKQVRDILWMDDLTRAYELAVKNVDKAAGQVYNIGGGMENTISVWQEFKPILERLAGKSLNVAHSDWRPGDQPIYVSDIRKAGIDLGWKPQISVHDGIEKLWAWIGANENELKELFR